MAADSKTVSVGALHNRRHQTGFDRAVDFDLWVLELKVSIHSRLRRFFGIDQNSGRAGKGAGSIQESGGNDSGTRRLAEIISLFELCERLDVVAEIPHSRHAASDVQGPVRLEELRMHVPHPCQQDLPR